MNKPKQIIPFQSDRGKPASQNKKYQTFESFLAKPKCIPYMGNWVRSFSKF